MHFEHLLISDSNYSTIWLKSSIYYLIFFMIYLFWIEVELSWLGLCQFWFFYSIKKLSDSFSF